MARLARARDIMTSDPACCTTRTSVDEVAKMMVQHNCGEIPVVDAADHVIGVITDRDIVCRVVAAGKNPVGHTVGECMSTSVVTVDAETSLEEVLAAMESHQIRRVPVVANGGCCVGIISQADLARSGPEHEVAELLCEVSQETGSSSR
jgi:CBS domain-containing protein